MLKIIPLETPNFFGCACSSENLYLTPKRSSLRFAEVNFKRYHPKAYIQIDYQTVSSFAGRSKIQPRLSNGKLGRGNGRANGSKKEWGFSLPCAHPFPLPSFPFDERAWIFDLPAKEETVLQSNI